MVGIVPSSAAARADPLIEVGDLLMEVQSKPCLELSHSEVVTLIHNAGADFTVRSKSQLGRSKMKY